MVGWLAARRAGFVRLTLYSLYLTSVFVICLYLTFPYAALEKRLITSVEHWASAWAPLTLSVGDGRLTFPPGVRWRNVSVYRVGVTDQIAQIDEAHLTLRSFSLWDRALVVGVGMQAFGGEQQGELTVEMTDRGARYQFTGVVEGIEMAQLSPLLPWGPVARGRLTLRHEQTWEVGHPEVAEGSMDVEIRPLSLTGLEVRGMALPPLEFTVFSATGYVRQHVGTLEELHAQGPKPCPPVEDEHSASV